MKTAVQFLLLALAAATLSGCCQMMPWLCVETKTTVVPPPYQLNAPERAEQPAAKP